MLPKLYQPEDVIRLSLRPLLRLAIPVPHGSANGTVHRTQISECSKEPACRDTFMKNKETTKVSMRQRNTNLGGVSFTLVLVVSCENPADLLSCHRTSLPLMERLLCNFCTREIRTVFENVFCQAGLVACLFVSLSKMNIARL